VGTGQNTLPKYVIIALAGIMPSEYSAALYHTDTHTYTYQRYIVGKVHCGENACVLDARCGERTHIRTDDTLWGKCIVGKIHTYVQTIHYGESALWGKSVHPSCCCGENTHVRKLIHCGESALWGKSVRLSWRCGENFVSPQSKFYFPTVQCFDLRHSL